MADTCSIALASVAGCFALLLLLIAVAIVAVHLGFESRDFSLQDGK
jgi:hypothetical protein